MTKKELALPSALKTDLETRSDEIAALLPSFMDAERFVRIALVAVTRNPGIQQCTRPSVLLSIMEAGRLGLMPDGKEAAIVPYRRKDGAKEATLLPMVQGFVNLIYRSSDRVKHVMARVVREGDEFDFRLGLNADLVHKPLGDDRRPITHSYAYVKFSDAEPLFEVMDIETLEQIRLSSSNPDGDVWKPEPQGWKGEMCRKSALKRLSKWLDLAPEVSRLIQFDNVAYGSEDQWDHGVPDGPSPEYERHLLKARTEDGLDDLAQRITGTQDPDEAPDEPDKADGARQPGEVLAWLADTMDKDQENGGTKGTRRSDDLQDKVGWLLSECFADSGTPDEDRHAVQMFITGKPSLTDWTGSELLATLRWLDAKKGPDDKYHPNAISAQEARRMLTAMREEA